MCLCPRCVCAVSRYAPWPHVQLAWESGSSRGGAGGDTRHRGLGRDCLRGAGPCRVVVDERLGEFDTRQRHRGLAGVWCGSQGVIPLGERQLGSCPERLQRLGGVEPVGRVAKRHDEAHP
jgi:hypothetical protein